MSKQHNKDEQSKNNDTLRALANFSQIGITMAATIFVGVRLVRFLDSPLGTSPRLLLIFSLLCAGAAIKSLFDMVAVKQ